MNKNKKKIKKLKKQFMDQLEPNMKEWVLDIIHKKGY